MKPITTTALVALMTASIGLTAIAPAFAQPIAPAQGQAQPFRHHDQSGPRHGGGMRGGADILSFERGAEAIEIALVRLSHAVDLTAEQQPLFDAFKASALAAATDFAAVTESLRPAAPAEGETATAPDLSQRLETGIALQKARLAALEAVQPAATAFFDSLTAEQMASLTPQRPDRDSKGPRPNGPRQHGGTDAPAPAEAAPSNG